jgi:hypothetical protein
VSLALRRAIALTGAEIATGSQHLAPYISSVMVPCTGQESILVSHYLQLRLSIWPPRVAHKKFFSYVILCGHANRTYRNLRG